jgi:hypothetical protein
MPKKQKSEPGHNTKFDQIYFEFMFIYVECCEILILCLARSIGRVQKVQENYFAKISNVAISPKNIKFLTSKFSRSLW